MTPGNFEALLFALSVSPLAGLVFVHALRRLPAPMINHFRRDTHPRITHRKQAKPLSMQSRLVVEKKVRGAGSLLWEKAMR
jgi:hypothetical protein